MSHETGARAMVGPEPWALPKLSRTALDALNRRMGWDGNILSDRPREVVKTNSVEKFKEYLAEVGADKDINKTISGNPSIVYFVSVSKSDKIAKYLVTQYRNSLHISEKILEFSAEYASARVFKMLREFQRDRGLKLPDFMDLMKDYAFSYGLTGRGIKNILADSHHISIGNVLHYKYKCSISNHALIERYANDPDETRRDIRKELGGYEEEDATVVFLTIVLCTDGYYDLGQYENPARRFFRICLTLPMELQMVISNRLYGLGADIIPSLLVNKEWTITTRNEGLFFGH